MFELVSNAVSSLQSETANYPQNIQLWMKLMGMSFLASVAFIYTKTGARLILLAFVLNILGLLVGKIVFPDASRTSIGTTVHILFWSPILWAVLRSFKQLSLSRAQNSLYDWTYIVWLAWVCLLMSTSLLLDVRTVLLTLF